MGNETSFRSFPAHIHNILSVTLAESHAVHSKIYPRYKSRKNITFARDDFSNWLAPHESPTTDVILIGHSLGGILAAEVVLIPGKPGSSQARHRILGQIAFDTPFLGMHPGVVSTGIASLFRSAPDQPEDGSPASPGMSPLENTSTNTSMSGISDLSSLSPSDPNYNPTFVNDVRLINREGKWEKGFYFFNKHWGELRKASKDYITSHLEFGGCLMDYPGLKRRYEAIRVLEDIDDFVGPGKRARVRFVNYYTASTGRIKERKETKSDDDEGTNKGQSKLQPPGEPCVSGTAPTSSTASPRISLSEHRDGQIFQKDLAELNIDNDGEPRPSTASDRSASSELAMLDPQPEATTPPRAATPPNEINSELSSPDTPPESSNSVSNTDSLPDLPPLPIPPIPFDPSTCHDPDTLKLRQKEHDRSVKAYERALKERNKTIREREKLVGKRQKTEQKLKDKAAKEELKRAVTLNAETYDKQLLKEAKASANPAAAPVTTMQKDRKFCTLPSSGTRSSGRDTTWIRVYMENMDEVVAHTSLFFMSETYAKLVGDTAERIEGWVNQDATRRAVMDAKDMD